MNERKSANEQTEMIVSTRCFYRNETATTENLEPLKDVIAHEIGMKLKKSGLIEWNIDNTSSPNIQRLQGISIVLRKGDD